jgi:hypothetical protein
MEKVGITKDECARLIKAANVLYHASNSEEQLDYVWNFVKSEGLARKTVLEEADELYKELSRELNEIQKNKLKILWNLFMTAVNEEHVSKGV